MYGCTLCTVHGVLPKESGWNGKPVSKVTTHSHVKHVGEEVL